MKEEQKIDQKIILLPHSVEPWLKLFLVLFLVTVGQSMEKMYQKCPENSQFLEKVSENPHYGPIS
jgi:hypothetical protein